MSYEEIVQEGKKYNWEIPDRAVDDAAAFLEAMGLAKKASDGEDPKS